MKYFQSVVDFVENNWFWVLVAFAAAVAVELLVFFIIKVRNSDEYDWDNFYTSVITNIVVLLGLYVVTCLCVGFVNCVRDQDWNFWANYLNFLTTTFGKIILGIGAVAGAIFAFGYLDLDGLIAKLIVALIGAALGGLAAFIIGFVGYVIVSFVIIVLKLIFFVVTGFFQSIWLFISQHWKEILMVLVIPGLLYGMISAFIHYIIGLKEEVFE